MRKLYEPQQSVGTVKKIKITTKGSIIYVDAYTGPEATTDKTVKGKLKTWSTLDSLENAFEPLAPVR